MKPPSLFIPFCFLAIETNSQNVGIGTLSPSTPLEVKSSITNHVLKIDGGTGMYVSFNEAGIYRGYIGSFSGADADVDFGTGTGNFLGKLHLAIQGSPRLTVDNVGNVGIGTTNPSQRLDVIGNVNVSGRLLINGAGGTAGQVLTSNGTLAPSWQTLNTAFQNNVRFAFEGSASFTGGLTQGTVTFTATRYNTNPTAVSFSGTNITVNQTGLYHFDISYGGRAEFVFSLADGAVPVLSLLIIVTGGTAGNYSGGEVKFFKELGAAVYRGRNLEGLDLYLTAGQQVQLLATFANTPPSFLNLTTSVQVRGYLINP